MAQIIECVPNFSEGQNKSVIDAIASAISNTSSVSLLDVDPGPSTNRTVYTFVGSPEAVINGAFNAAKAAIPLIDMTKQTGEHPRLGAMDVCPFIPVKNATMEDCVQCAEKLGQRLAEELQLPIYLYGFASKHDYRRTVPQIRAGEYEGLKDRICKDEWKPDFGPTEFQPNWGASMVGARTFLIAYNINVLGTKEQAHRIALNIREQGRGADQPGRLKAVQGIGWYLDESNMAQVSVNITDIEVTPIHTVFEECKKDAAILKLPIAGSQIVGLVPLEAILVVAEFYIKKEELFILDEDQKVNLAIDRLGLHSLGYFNPKERIIDYMVKSDRVRPLIAMSVEEFVLKVGSRSPAPGGGSVSALVASLGAGLAAMGGYLTYGNKKFESLDSTMRKLLPPLYSETRNLLPYIDEDTFAFDDYMDACKTKATTDEEKQTKVAKQQDALKRCIQVPLRLMKNVSELWSTLEELAKLVNVSCMSDVQVATKCLETATFGAHCNVFINLVDLKDAEYKSNVTLEAHALKSEAEQRCCQILAILTSRTSD